MKERSELPFLEALVRFHQAKICVEVGVAKGQAAMHLCRALTAGGQHYYGFDAWKRYGQAKEFKALGSREKVLDKLRRSQGANPPHPFLDFQLFEIDTIANRAGFIAKLDELGLKDNIDFAFIDADHSYLGIQNDFTVIYPRLAPRGMIVFHDTCSIDGCREFILDLRTNFYDGTYDIIDIPLGNGVTRNPGITILAKRYHSMPGFAIDEVNGSKSRPFEIERRESEWLNNEATNSGMGHSCLPVKIFTDQLGRYKGRNKFEEIS